MSGNGSIAGRAAILRNQLEVELLRMELAATYTCTVCTPQIADAVARCTGHSWLDSTLVTLDRRRAACVQSTDGALHTAPTRTAYTHSQSVHIQCGFILLLYYSNTNS